MQDVQCIQLFSFKTAFGGGRSSGFGFSVMGVSMGTIGSPEAIVVNGPITPVISPRNQWELWAPPPITGLWAQKLQWHLEAKQLYRKLSQLADEAGSTQCFFEVSLFNLVIRLKLTQSKSGEVRSCCCCFSNALV